VGSTTRQSSTPNLPKRVMGGYRWPRVALVEIHLFLSQSSPHFKDFGVAEGKNQERVKNNTKKNRCACKTISHQQTHQLPDEVPGPGLQAPSAYRCHAGRNAHGLDDGLHNWPWPGGGALSECPARGRAGLDAVQPGR
jgi:hypothetical protein